LILLSTLDSQRCLRRLGLCFVAGCALLLAGYVFRAPLLTGLAEAWVVNEPVTKADAIVILGGGLENRPFAAAKLFHDGVAPQVLYMDVQPGPAEELGVSLPEKEQTRRILSSNSVPETAMTVIGAGVSSTFDESRAVRAWLEKAGAKSIVIPTDPFHTRGCAGSSARNSGIQRWRSTSSPSIRFATGSATGGSMKKA
jgi:uncharacterized SAM-binding protein YcdF (DUF218 family)